MDNNFENIFKYHPPKENQPIRYEKIREECLSLARMIDGFCPESEEKRISIEKLSECCMWANASIARNE